MSCRLIVIGQCIIIDFDRYMLCFCVHCIRLCVVFFIGYLVFSAYLYRVSLLDCVSAEYQARKRKMLNNTPVALLATMCRCRASPFLGIQFDTRKVVFVITGVGLQPVLLFGEVCYVF